MIHFNKSEKILLIEPNYKNKYPPMGLMKIATYYRKKGAHVRFFKGDLKDLVAEQVCLDLINHLTILFPETYWDMYWNALFNYLKTGKKELLKTLPISSESEIVLEAISQYRHLYKNNNSFKNPMYDKVIITTLFTFYWKITVDTINFAKKLCKSPDGVIVGGVMASLLPDEIYNETGIYPHVGALNAPSDLGKNDDVIIDELPLDYSILEEIDYTYPANNAYFAYMTRGCVNRCSFCAVPRLEPKFVNYIGLKKQLEETNKRFGPQKDLLLLDNNILASDRFDEIINEIISCGFGKNATYISPNQYEITINNLKESYNDFAYIRKMTKIYHDTIRRLKTDEADHLFKCITKAHCLSPHTATKESILMLDPIVRPYYEKTHKANRSKRTLDFNQGIDSRLITDEKMKKLSETSIKPLRIAFDHWNLRDTYENAVRLAVKHGIRDLSNYLLYNHTDKPEELYYRIRLNIELCDDLDAKIYSFPMKYHPISDPDFVKNRDWIGEHWNRKFIRAVQSILNSTKGKVGTNVDFFEGAFGKDVNEFYKILWMPEAFIISRRKYDANLRQKLAGSYSSVSEDAEDYNDLTNEWWNKFSKLPENKLKQAKEIIAANVFTDLESMCSDSDVLDVLSYYKSPKRI